MRTDRVPPYLRDHARFCVWTYRSRDGRPTKIPYNPTVGSKARSNAPDTFASYEQATGALTRRPSAYTGLGVGMFGDLVGVDIDHCVDDSGQLSDLARDVIAKLGSYTERSPSGTGVHVLCRAPGLRYSKDRYLLNNRELGLEVYPAGHTNRFLTLTGDALNDEDVNIRTDEITELLEKYMSRGDPTVDTPTPAPLPTQTAADDPDTCVIDDSEVLDRMLKSKEADLIAQLWGGEWEGRYGSQSDADMALCNRLAFWTQKDPVQMDRMFRASGLMRDKWDELRGVDTYGELTIREAIRGTQNVWTPGYGKSPAPNVERALAFLHEVDLAHNERYRRDDVGAGYLLADYLKPFARPIGKGKAWMVYDGKRWVDDKEEATAEEAAKDISRALSNYAAELPESEMRDYLDWARAWTQRNRRTQFIRDAVSAHPVTRASFDRDPWLLNLNNGTLDLQTMEFRPHTPDDMLTQLAPVDYDPAAVCPRWEQFIQEIMVPGDTETLHLDKETVTAEKADFLQRYLGYCLCGDTTAEAFLVMYGPTSRNGKGTCVSTVQTILGDYSKAMNPESLMVGKLKDGRGPSEDIARLSGVRMASVGEIQQGAKLNASLVKQLTGGDSVNARFLGENSFDFVPQCKLLLHTNHLPQCSDLSVFDSGRALVLTFGRHFEAWEQDKSLKSELRKPENQSGILNWLLDGFRAYRSRGLGAPEAVRLATRDYRKDSDKVARFMEDALAESPDGEIRLSLLYSHYQIWCRENGQFPENSRNFRRSLEQAGIHITKKRPKGGGENTTTMVLGYCVLSDFAQSA